MSKVVAVILLILGLAGAEKNQKEKVTSTFIPSEAAGTEKQESEKSSTAIPLVVPGAEKQTEAEPKEVVQVEMKTVDEENINESSEETEMLKEKIKDDTGLYGNQWHVSTRCLDCLWRMTSGYTFGTLLKGCQGGSCGPFGISYVFWEDAFSYKLPDGPSFEADANMENKWRRCSIDLVCSTKAIQQYFQKYPHDCNQDGKVDCLDYAAIHLLGPFGCMEKENLEVWNQMQRKDLLKCMARNEDGPYAKKMLELEKVMGLRARKVAEREKRKSFDTNKIKIQSVGEKLVSKTNEKPNDFPNILQVEIV